MKTNNIDKERKKLVKLTKFYYTQYYIKGGNERDLEIARYYLYKLRMIHN